MSHGLENCAIGENGFFFACIVSNLPKDIFKPAPCKTHVLVAQLKYTKNLYKNWIFRKFKYARKEEFYTPIICFGQFVGHGSRG